MATTLINDPVLVRFRKALDDMCGDRLERVVLFGSRARGDAHAESDYDMAVFLRDMEDLSAEMDRLADLGTRLIDQTGEFVHAMPYRAGAYNERTPLMLGIRQIAKVALLQRISETSHLRGPNLPRLQNAHEATCVGVMPNLLW
jgi:uncharacterized protein